MFDKNKFAQILKEINETYESQRIFAKKSEINRTYLSQYMNMKLDKPPKPKILEQLSLYSNNIVTYKELMEVCGYLDNNSQFYMCPVYKQTDKLNLEEANIEGRIPINTNLMNILQPEDYFFLHINDDSMNRIIKNNAFALIHKQNIVADGDIALILINDSNAALKKLTKHDGLIVLEPQSNNKKFKAQIYDKNTSIKILGKYVGKIEINN